MARRPFDPNANSLDRIRRSLQKMNKGAIVPTIPAGTYLVGSTALGTTVPLTGGGNLSTGLTIAIPQATSTANGYLTSTDWTTFNNKVSSSRAINTTAPLTGGGNLSADLTLSMPQVSSTANGWLSSTQYNTLTAAAAPIVAADASILVGSSSGSTTLAVQEYSAGGISTNGSGIGIKLGSTSGTTVLLDFLPSTYAASTDVYTIGGNGTTWWTAFSNGSNSLTIGSTLATGRVWTLNHYAQAATSSTGTWWAQYVPGFSLASHYQVQATMLNNNGAASGVTAAMGFAIRLPATGSATSTSGIVLEYFADALRLYANFNTLLGSTAVGGGGSDHIVLLDVNNNTLTVFFDGVQQFSATSGHDSGNSNVAFFNGQLDFNSSSGVKELKVSNTAANTYPDLAVNGTGLFVLLDPNGGIMGSSTGLGVCCLSTVSADPGSPSEGQMWYNSTTQTPKVTEDSTILGIGGIQSINSTDSATLNNITTFTTFNTSTLLAANFFTPGKIVRVKAAGQIVTNAAQQVALNLAVAGQGIQTPNFVTAGASTLVWQIEMTTVCRASSTSTNNMHQIFEAVIQPQGSASGAVFAAGNQVVGINTASTCSVISQFAATVANNTALCRHFEVEVLN